MSLRAVFSVVAQKGWKINSMDIKAAFLQGENIKRELFILPPPEAKTMKIWKLKKCIYGLCDASLMWYDKVKNTMKSLNGKVSKTDPAVFYWTDSNGLIGVVACHVDDFFGQETRNLRKL